MRAINFKFENEVITMVEHNGRYIVENCFGGVAVYADCRRKEITIITDKSNDKIYNEVVISVITKDRIGKLDKVKQMLPMQKIENRPKITIKEADLISYIINFGIMDFNCEIGR